MPPSGSPRRGFRSGAPILFPAALALLAALLLWGGWGRLQSCGTSVESPDTQIRQSLASQPRAHLDDVYGFRAGGTVELHSVRYRDVVASVAGGRAAVVALLDAEGRVAWRDQSAGLSYLGREAFHMRPCSIALWCAEGDQFDRLRGVLLVLFRRLDAFEARDAAAYARLVSERYRDGAVDRAGLLARVSADLRAAPPARVRVISWQIRVDRDTAEAGEDYEISVGGEVPRRLRARYQLAREGSRWLVAGGL